MNIQDYLNRYVNKKLNLISTEIRLDDMETTIESILIKASNGYGVEVLIRIPISTDLDGMFKTEKEVINVHKQ